MSVSHNVVALNSGEVSPKFYNRTDLTKYPLGASEATNFFVNFEGGVSNRPGSQFVGPLTAAGTGVRMFRWRSTGNDYVLILVAGKMYWMRDGGLYTELARTTTGYTPGASTWITTSAAHGYATGDIVYTTMGPGAEPSQLDARFWQVGATTSTTFEILEPHGAAVDSTTWAAWTAGTNSVVKIDYVTVPYTDSEVSQVRLTQIKTKGYLTHQNHPPQEVELNTTAEVFFVSEAEAGSNAPAPGQATLTPSAAGSAGVGISITAVDQDGNESIPSRTSFNLSSVNYSVSAGSMRATWGNVAGAQYYNVYRTLLQANGQELTLADDLGYLGRTYGPRFVDNNITPDFTKTPPLRSSPFVNGAIAQVNLTAGGSGYVRSAVVTVSDATGSGAVIWPVVTNGGQVISFRIIDPGRDYTAPSISISGGTGATATIVLSGDTGNYPSVSARFQQRVVFGSTINNPETIWGTKSGTEYNFDFNIPPIGTDSYTFTLDSPDVSPIRHMVALRQGLLLFTNYGVFQLRAATGAGVTATNALTDAQAYKSVGEVEPLAIDLNVLFMQQEATAVYSMNYTYYTESFQLQDISVLASHLFKNNNKVIRMDFMEEPDKLVYATREDGTRLIGTYEPEQEVIAWTKDHTQGLYKDQLVIQEDERFTLYQIVDRYIDGAWRRYIERQYYRDAVNDEDAKFVDCGVEFALFSGSTTLTRNGTTLTVPSGSVGSVGTRIFVGGGRARIDTVTSSTEVEVTWEIDPTDNLPSVSVQPPRTYAIGEWQYSLGVTTVSGLSHLEGEAVSVLADGNVIEGLTVTDGAITLPRTFYKVTVGLPYTARLVALPPSSQQIILDDKRKSFMGAAVHTEETRGLMVGTVDGDLYEIPNRTTEAWGEIIREYDGRRFVLVEDGWAMDAQMVYEQRYPLPAGILGFATTLEIGDDG